MVSAFWELGWEAEALAVWRWRAVLALCESNKKPSLEVLWGTSETLLTQSRCTREHWSIAVPRATLLSDDHGGIVGMETWVLLVLGKEDSLLEIAGTSTSTILFYVLYSDSALPLLFSAIFHRSGIVYTKLFSLLYHSRPLAHHPPAWILLTGLEEDGMNLLSGCFAKIRVLVLLVLL